MAYPDYQFSALDSRTVRNARLYANRTDLVRGLGLPAHNRIVEVGVAIGEFSKVLIDHFKPAQFYAIDLFEMHLQPVHWGIASATLLDGKSHKKCYEDNLSGYGGTELIIHQGTSYECLASYEDGFFDLIYLDADHSYEFARKDAEQAVRVLSERGVIIFNDYTMMDPLLGVPYGVVQVVNNLLADENWEIIGFALNKYMFCDVAIRRLDKRSRFQRLTAGLQTWARKLSGG